MCLYYGGIRWASLRLCSIFHTDESDETTWHTSSIYLPPSVPFKTGLAKAVRVTEIKLEHCDGTYLFYFGHTGSLGVDIMTGPILRSLCTL